MKVRYIACAASSSVDHKTNELSLFQVMDEVAADGFPLRLPSLCVAALFERDAHEPATQSYAMTVSLDAALVASFALQVDFAGARRSRSVNTVKGLAIPAPGLVAVRLAQKSEMLAEWSFVAFQAAAEPPRSRTGPPREAPRVATKSGTTMN